MSSLPTREKPKAPHASARVPRTFLEGWFLEGVRRWGSYCLPVPRPQKDLCIKPLSKGLIKGLFGLPSPPLPPMITSRLRDSALAAANASLGACLKSKWARSTAMGSFKSRPLLNRKSREHVFYANRSACHAKPFEFKHNVSPKLITSNEIIKWEKLHTAKVQAKTRLCNPLRPTHSRLTVTKSLPRSLPRRAAEQPEADGGNCRAIRLRSLFMFLHNTMPSMARPSSVLHGHSGANVPRT